VKQNTDNKEEYKFKNEKEFLFVLSVHFLGKLLNNFLKDIIVVILSPIIVTGIWKYKKIYLLYKNNEMSNETLITHAWNVVCSYRQLITMFLIILFAPWRILMIWDQKLNLNVDANAFPLF
jgi:hypothetical protein